MDSQIGLTGTGILMYNAHSQLNFEKKGFPMQIIIDHDRARLVFDRLIRALRKREYPYNVAQLPQVLFPKRLQSDPLRLAQFIFYVCHFMRGALDSTHAIKQLAHLWRISPWMLDPTKVIQHSVEEIREQLKTVIDYHLDEIAGFWLENSKRLLAKWRDDPRRIFTNAKTFADAVRYVANKDSKAALVGDDLFEHEWGFLGFQGKMTGMLIYFLVYFRLIKEPRQCPPAVDFHLCRGMTCSKILILPAEWYEKGVRYDQLYQAGVNAIVAYKKLKPSVTAVEIGDALWLLSAHLCAQAPGNWSIGRSKARFEKGERKPLPKFVHVTQDNLRHTEAYDKTCARCPIEKWCEFNAPSGPYYEVGKFILHKRVKLKPRKTLFGNSLHDHPRPRRHAAGPVVNSTAEPQLSLFQDIEPDA